MRHECFQQEKNFVYISFIHSTQIFFPLIKHFCAFFYLQQVDLETSQLNANCDTVAEPCSQTITQSHLSFMSA